MEKKIKRIIAKILNLDLNKIKNNSSVKNIENWDSINNIKILIEIESLLKIKFSESDFHRHLNVKKIIDLAKKLIK